MNCTRRQGCTRTPCGIRIPNFCSLEGTSRATGSLGLPRQVASAASHEHPRLLPRPAGSSPCKRLRRRREIHCPYFCSVLHRLTGQTGRKRYAGRLLVVSTLSEATPLSTDVRFSSLVPSESGDLHYFRNIKIDIYMKDFLAATRHTRHRVSDCRGQEAPIGTLAEVNTIMTTPSSPIQCCKPFAGRRQLAL